MKKYIAFITFLFAILIITGCSANEMDEKTDNPNGNLSPTEDDVNEVEIQMSNFFYPAVQKRIIRAKAMNLQNLILK